MSISLHMYDHETLASYVRSKFKYQLFHFLYTYKKYSFEKGPLMFESWYLNNMVTQKMMRKHDGKSDLYLLSI